MSETEAGPPVATGGPRSYAVVIVFLGRLVRVTTNRASGPGRVRPVPVRPGPRRDESDRRGAERPRRFQEPDPTQPGKLAGHGRGGRGTQEGVAKVYDQAPQRRGAGRRPHREVWGLGHAGREAVRER